MFTWRPVLVAWLATDPSPWRFESPVVDFRTGAEWLNQRSLDRGTCARILAIVRASRHWKTSVVPPARTSGACHHRRPLAEVLRRERGVVNGQSPYRTPCLTLCGISYGGVCRSCSLTPRRRCSSNSSHVAWISWQRSLISSGVGSGFCGRPVLGITFYLFPLR